MFNLKSKVLFGIAVSMVLAMAIGSFALGESKTQASPHEVEVQSLVGATAGPFTVEGGTQGTDYDYASSVLTIHSGDLTISTTAQTAERIVVDGAATITLAGVNISTGSGPALQIRDNATFNVNILLADGSNNILKATANNYAGLKKNGSGDNIGTLTIGVPDGSAGTGKLEAIGGNSAAGIGGGNYGSASNITITNGEVTATGQWAAGIGGGYNGSGSNITISGGVVKATSGAYGAGIGGGSSGSASNITISGGVVKAYGGNTGAGIGGGGNGSGSYITIGGGVVTATGGGQYGAGIGGGDEASGSNITISGGVVTANGGVNGAGIGGGNNGDGSYITITGGIVNATGYDGAGIGGGWGMSGSGKGNASKITISGGEVTATGGECGAGIGSGKRGVESEIEITGGVVKAYGGKMAAGIGAGDAGSGSNNSISGYAVVFATSGGVDSAGAMKDALDGFEDEQGESLLIQGIAFTGVGTAFDDDRPIDFSWDEGTVYGDTTLLDNLEIPVTLTVPAEQSLTINQGVTLTVPAGMALQNEGILTVNGTVDCLDDQAAGTTGKVTTKTDFYLEDSTDVYATGYQTYQTSAGVQKYTNLPNPDQTNANGFVNWYYVDQDGKKIKIDENTFVALNAHSFYENLHSISVAELENGSVIPDVTGASKDDTVTLTVTPDEGYQLKEGSLTVTDADGNEVPVTEQDGKYTFTMPGADVTVNAAFELIPEPTVDPDQSGDGSGASSKTGDSFAGIAALAILGVATTGAALLRKRK